MKYISCILNKIMDEDVCILQMLGICQMINLRLTRDLLRVTTLNKIPSVRIDDFHWEHVHRSQRMHIMKEQNFQHFLCLTAGDWKKIRQLIHFNYLFIALSNPHDHLYINSLKPLTKSMLENLQIVSVNQMNAQIKMTKIWKAMNITI